MQFHKINYPKDELKHKNDAEWWYFNGFLESNKERFAYMHTLFRVDLSKNEYLKYVPFHKFFFKNLYFSHSMLLNLKTDEMVKDIKYKIIPTKESFKNNLLFFEYENCELREKRLFNYTLKNKFLELELKSNKQPLLENKTGIIKDSKYYTYYYSLTNLKTKGIIKWKNKLIEVQGKSWHDHQWMGNITKNIKWDWFSIMLDNNEEIVISRTKASDEDYKIYATRIDSKNKQYNTHKVILTANKKITLKKKEYIVDWQIKIPDWNLDLNAKAIHNEQQMEYKFLTYWEGPILIECINTKTKKKVKGQGFLEMVH